MNFGFSVELYIKLLRNLADGNLMHGHNLLDLFLKLDEAAPQVGATAIRNHYSSRDRVRDRAEGAMQFTNRAR
jgi:hypothetical protein